MPRRVHRATHGPNYWHRFNAYRWRPGGPTEYCLGLDRAVAVDGVFAGARPRWARRFPHVMIPTRRRARLIVEYAERQAANRRAQRAAAERVEDARSEDSWSSAWDAWAAAAKEPDCAHDDVTSAVDGGVMSSICNSCRYVWVRPVDDLTALADAVFQDAPGPEERSRGRVQGDHVVDLGGGWRWRRTPDGGWESAERTDEVARDAARLYLNDLTPGIPAQRKDEQQ